MNISDLMTNDEYIVKTIELKGRFSIAPKTRVYATNIRLLIDRGEFIKDIVYQHISSMTIKGKFGIPWLIIGFILVCIGVVELLNIIDFLSDVPEVISIGIIAFGLILVAFGLMQSKVLSITVPGMNADEVLTGARVDLEKLFVIVRQTHTRKYEGSY